MDHENCKEGRQTTIQFRCAKKLSHEEERASSNIQRKKEEEIRERDCSLASPTPEKRIQPPRSRKYKEHSYNFKREKDKLVPDSSDDPGVTDVSSESLKEKTGQLSDKYKILVEIFDQMVVAIRLLCLRKRPTNFHNISTQVEILTKKKFSPSYLAQMKYLLPEAIQIEKILVHDESSLCMASDVRVSLKIDAINGLSNLQQASYIDLCQAFKIRLLGFLSSQPEDTDIPEASIPQPSSRLSSAISPDHLPATSSSPDQPSPLHCPSHLPSTFRGYFSQKIINRDELMGEAWSNVEDTPAHSLPKKEGSITSSPVDGQHVDQTPVKPISVKLMTETPALPTPKRPEGSPSLSARRVLLYEVNALEKTSSRRQHVLASLQSTVSTIASVVGASNSSTITKQELVHKILSYNCDVEDPCEVEEQLRLLEELVPDWIRCMTMSTGDSLYRISGASDPKAVQARLVANSC